MKIFTPDELQTGRFFWLPQILIRNLPTKAPGAPWGHLLSCCSFSISSGLGVGGWGKLGDEPGTNKWNEMTFTKILAASKK